MQYLRFFTITVSLMLSVGLSGFVQAQTGATPNPGFEAFKANVYPILKKDCAQCHDGSNPMAPEHSTSDLKNSYEQIKRYVKFQDLKTSKILRQIENKHWSDSIYPTDHEPAVTRLEMQAAIEKWLNDGESDNQMAEMSQGVALKAQMIPNLSPNQMITLKYAVNANLAFSVDVRQLMSSGNAVNAYLLQNVRLTSTKNLNVKLKKITVTVNGKKDDRAMNFDNINEIMKVSAGSAQLSTLSQIVLMQKGMGQDTLGFLFEKLEETTQPITTNATAENNQKAVSKDAAQAKDNKNVDPKNVIDAFNPVVVGKAADFASIPAGEFEMGSLEIEPNRSSDEKLHKVRLSKGFEIGSTEVTQLQWYLVMGGVPSRFIDKEICDANNYFVTKDGNGMCKNHPVETVSWNDVQTFIDKLNGMQNQYKYRLPTEAEWEYVTKNNLPPEYAYGFGPDFDASFAWFFGNSNNRTHEVGTKEATTFGTNNVLIYDLHGNVWEWVNDWYDSNLGLTDQQLTSVVLGPQGPTTGSDRVIRGGSWGNGAQGLRSGNRYGSSPGPRNIYLGFRLVRTK